jgi:metal-sulfur cluster biosynthetic enzyme
MQKTPPTELRAALDAIVEPGTGLSISELGLLYGVEVEDEGRTAVVKVAQVPLARRLLKALRAAIEAAGDFEEGRLEFVKDPPWNPDTMATPEARVRLAELASRPVAPARVEDVWEHVSEVVDPEMGMTLVELGLVYGIDLDEPGRRAHLRMTLTSPMCPVGPYLIEAVRQSALLAPGLEDAEVELVWDPPWDPRTMASEDARMDLGLL